MKTALRKTLWLGIALGATGLLFPQASPAATATPKTSDPRTVFVQMFEWPWQDIGRECELYLGPNGFAAVQVSPPTEHMVWDGSPWWERYQPVSYNLVSRSGSEEEFRDMIRRCHRAGVDVYVDVVMNHMAGIDEGHGQSGTTFTHYSYPGLWGFDDFHHCGRHRESPSTYDRILDFSNLFELQNCELVHLADLATEKPHVRQTLAAYLNRLLDLGADGFRVDAAKHIPASDIHAILQMTKRQAYVVQELILSAGEPVRDVEYLQNGDYTVFSYAFDVGRAFRNRNLGNLRAVGYSGGYPDSQDAVVFVENHDMQRRKESVGDLVSFQDDPQLARLAHVFMLAWPYGYPQVMSGFRFTDYDQGPPVDSHRMTLPVLDSRGSCASGWLCQHRSSEVAPMVQFRNTTDATFYPTDWWSTSEAVAFGRADKGFVVINAGSSALKRTFQTSLKPGVYCDILDPYYDVQRMGCGRGRFEVDRQGGMALELPPMSARAFHFRARLN